MSGPQRRPTIQPSLYLRSTPPTCSALPSGNSVRRFRSSRLSRSRLRAPSTPRSFRTKRCDEYRLRSSPTPTSPDALPRARAQPQSVDQRASSHVRRRAQTIPAQPRLKRTARQGRPPSRARRRDAHSPVAGPDRRLRQPVVELYRHAYRRQWHGGESKADRSRNVFQKYWSLIYFESSSARDSCS